MTTDKEDQVLQYGTRCIPYRLHISERKRLRIVVSPSLAVNVYAPNTASEDDIVSAVQVKAPWITKQLDALQQFHPLPTPHKYISGETFTYLGRQYRLKVIQDMLKSAKLHGRFLHIAVPDKTETVVVKKQVIQWYRERAESIFKRYLIHWLNIGLRHNIPEPVLVIRQMKTRWGSCSSSGRITLNIKLIHVPIHCIEYVIMHELCHLKHHNHSKEYFRLLSRCMPDWKRRKHYLDHLVVS
ncbi:MAG: SprT family zinc-dependent metalloprotease [Kiritimatiellae bacterium]|nr:SprT family zinc-dependent metalloprotease [Kiritimatiellia bacterium]